MELIKRAILGTFAETRKIGKYHSPLTVAVDIEIRATEKGLELSICGDTHYSGARDIESGGQILDDVRRLLADAALAPPAARLDKQREQIMRLLEIWERWHLNGMRAECEHQRAEWRPDDPIPLVTYKLRSEVLVKRHELAHAAIARLERAETVAYNLEELKLAHLPYEVTVGADQLSPGAEYAEEKREVKTAGWVYPKEHPRGLLCKPCPTCGYKYGSAWLYEPLPSDVVEFLENF